MDDPDLNVTRISAAKTKRLFFNAEGDPDTKRVFASAAGLSAPKRQELAPEQPAVNPYQDIEERNARMDAARLEAAKVSDQRQQLVREPSRAVATKVETVKMEELPAMVRQAAEAALLKKLHRRR